MPTLTDPATLALARHYATMGGWRHAALFTPANPDTAANNELALHGHIEETTVNDGRTRIFQLTASGWAYARQGS